MEKQNQLIELIEEDEANSKGPRDDEPCDLADQAYEAWRDEMRGKTAEN